MLSQELIDALEKRNTNTSPTNNPDFDKNGYLVVKNFIDPKELYSDIPLMRGQYLYHMDGKETYDYSSVEPQVVGSTSRYWYPQYHQLHSIIGQRLEKILDTKLYKTFYYDRFYFSGQCLYNHVDRDSCEISISIHIQNNFGNKGVEWPFYIKTPDTYSDETKKKIIKAGEIHSVILNPGDGVIYKGCERPHWRDKLEEPKKGIFGRFQKEKEYYYHQIFFHYVLRNGIRSHCAFDMGK